MDEGMRITIPHEGFHGSPPPVPNAHGAVIKKLNRTPLDMFWMMTPKVLVPVCVHLIIHTVTSNLPSSFLVSRKGRDSTSMVNFVVGRMLFS